jgi:hypothetical protein
MQTIDKDGNIITLATSEEDEDFDELEEEDFDELEEEMTSDDDEDEGIVDEE